MPTISILIPVYNTEDYIAECIDSVLAQSFTDFEVLLINDGSTDNSLEICREYSARDYRLKILDKENGGVSSARNLGLNNACGDYVLFMDSDDIIPSDCLSSHLKHFSDEVDLTLGAMALFTVDSISYTILVEREELKTVTDSLRDFVPSGKQDWHRYMVNRMFRMSIIRKNRLLFNERIAYKEDGLFLVQYMLRCTKKVAYFPETVYLYRQNPASAMGGLTSGQTSKLTTNIDAHALIIREMRLAGVAEDIINKEVAHALSSRRWVLNLLKDSGTNSGRIWLDTLLKILAAVGLKRSLQIISEKALHQRFIAKFRH